MKRSLMSLAVAFALGGCTLIPDYQRPDAPVAAHYPQGPGFAPAGSAQPGPADRGAAEQGWREFYRDPALQQLIATALQNNRDLRAAALNLESYQALYRIQRAEIFPAIGVQGDGVRQRLPADLSQSGKSTISSQYSVMLGMSAYELDFFGRLRSLSQEALETYLSSEQARRSTQITLVSSVATAYFTWQADQALLRLTEQTLATYEDSYRLVQRSNQVGVATALELSQSRTSVESARASLAQYQRQVAQDYNNLTLLLGGPLPAALPQALPLDGELLAEVPAGLPSDLLERRPDILEAEHLLKAANADIGAARAAFFPTISLTAGAGTASAQLSGLFKGGSGSWQFEPTISIPIFTAGSLKANLDYSTLQKDVRVAQYEKSIQTAFREVSDGLVARQTYQDQLQAQRDLVSASQDYYRLAEHRYNVGIDNQLTFLDARRQLFSAQQALISDRLAQLTSEVDLYRALGGGWNEHSQQQTPQG